MKKILSFAVLFAGLSFLASAQDDGTIEKKDGRHRNKMTQTHFENKSPEEIAKTRTERLDKELKFTEAQRKDVYAYNLDQAKKFKQRADVQKKDREAMRSEMKADQERFKNILTPEQQKILAEKSKIRMRAKNYNFKGKKDGKRQIHKPLKEKSTNTENSNSWLV